jgi:hypothetical protein
MRKRQNLFPTKTFFVDQSPTVLFDNMLDHAILPNIERVWESFIAPSELEPPGRIVFPLWLS